MSSFELDVGRAEPQRLVDDQVRRQRTQPARRKVGIDPQDSVDDAQNPHLHQQECEDDVEHEPDDTARMAVGQAREEIRPGDRARVSVRDVDLQLANDDEDTDQHESHRRGMHGFPEGHEVHVGWLHRMFERYAVAQSEDH